MATLPRSRLVQRPSAQARVRSLLRLNDAVQRISGILELDVLLDRVVNEIAAAFGCLEACVLLKDGSADEVVIAAVMGCTQCGKRDRFRVAVDGLVGWVAASGMPLYTPDVTKEPRYIACEPSTMSELDLPLIAHGEVIGVFSAQHPELDGFPAEQRALLEALAGHIAVAIYNARLYESERAARARMCEQEEEARRIQQALFPKLSPRVPGVRVEGTCLPAGAVGGDFYDFVPIRGSEKWGVVLADVSGKGMAAALLMSATRALLRSVGASGQAPSETLKQVNETLLGDIPAGRFVTAVYGILDPQTRTFVFANAGHPWPMFANGDVQMLSTNCGLPLGIGACDFDDRTVELKPGSRLLLYSDGITEAANVSGEEYGLDRLCGLVQQRDLSAEAIIDEVRHYSTSTLADDATAIVIRADS